MLDTPEDAAANQAEIYEDDDPREVSTPRMGSRYASAARGAYFDDSTDYHPRQHQHHHQQASIQYKQAPLSLPQQQLYVGQPGIDDRVTGSLLSTHGSLDSLQEQSHGHFVENQSGWNPMWQGSAVPGAIHENSQSLSALPPRSSSSPHHNGTHHHHNVGLYLP
jgi:hypothetical protein